MYRVSAYITDEPYFLDKAKFPYQLYSPRSAGIDFYGDNLFTTERQIADHPQRVKAFREASLKGWRYAMSYPEETVELILARYPQKKTRAHLLYEARQMQALMFPELIEIGYMFPGRWQHIAETYADLDLLPKDFALAGFLYDPNPYPLSAFVWLFAIVMVALIVIFIVSHIALRYFRLSNKLDKLLYIKNYHANVGESVNTISHQWKQPLNELGIQMMLIEALLEQSPVNGATAEIQRITAKSHDILDFMADTVDVFRNFLSTNNQVRHFNPARVIRETLQLVAENFQDEAIVIEYDGEGESRISANPTEFAHVILSILVNAKDVFRERKTTGAMIKIHLYSVGDRVHITIADNAGGIKVRPVSRVFQLGFSTKAGAKSGIGLYVARKIIKDKMFGTISVENSGDGAVFRLCIPVYAVH
ncbi:MAG: ATP-binding protein [Methylobacter sp.]|nr:ATP-binding protein [Methylobacter sp.]MDP2098153.1 ATP-binding protein [Methylobacter sp.]MDP2428191.1 ATP-binding protein [Methylobacter sp.]MDP3054108.1 ATP-binding protein [Methylobacter sp.]MDP3361660.1 ATP-binding protein [Methylobacter sp.]